MAYNYTISYKTHALNIEGSMKLNTENDLGYQFGNQISNTINYYWSLPYGSWVFIPFTGLNYEHADKHTDNEIIQANTGGHTLLGNLGLQVFLKQFVFTSQYQVPLAQQYNTDEISTIEANNRFSIGLNYNIIKS